MPRRSIAPPEPPDWLDAEAAAFWRQHATGLHSAGRLTDADLPAFSGLCRYWSKWRAADAEAAKLGAVVRTQAGGAGRNPYEVQAEKCWARVEALLAQFGLTPASRNRRPANADAPRVADADLAALLVDDPLALEDRR